MISIKTIRFPEIFHIGFLSSREDRKPSLDGPGISVTTRPEHWRAIKGLNAPEIRLTSGLAQWLDGFALDQQDLEVMRRWCVLRNYMRCRTGWQGVKIDPETGDVQDLIFLTREEGAKAFGRTLPEEIAAAARGEGALQEVETMVLTRRGEKLLERWPGMTVQWEQAAILLYVREVVLPKRPFIAGVWWSEPEIVEAKAGPCGILFPERLRLFEVETEDGDFGEIQNVFPDLDLPPDPRLKEDWV